MNFSRRSPLLFLLLLLIFPAACQRRISPEEKAIRAELRSALQAREFEKAIPLARRVLEFAPHDNGAWARLAQG